MAQGGHGGKPFKGSKLKGQHIHITMKHCDNKMEEDRRGSGNRAEDDEMAGVEMIMPLIDVNLRVAAGYRPGRETPPVGG